MQCTDTFSVPIWRVRLVGQDTALSRPVHGFESRTRCQTSPRRPRLREATSGKRERSSRGITVEKINRRLRSLETLLQIKCGYCCGRHRDSTRKCFSQAPATSIRPNPRKLGVGRERFSNFRPRNLSFVGHYFHGFSQVAFRGSIISLGNCYKDGVEYVELSDSGGCILAEKRRTAGCRS
jgi:hypothetical protein